MQRWVDVSNLEHGVTWATVDAPLVQMGEIRTDIGPYLTSPEVWLNHIQPSATLYSYIMNNYWETNYKADQGGNAEFCYSIRPHIGPYDQTRAARFGIERSRPLIAIPARADGPAALPSLFAIDAPGVIATSVKPSRDGRAMMIRLFAISGKPEQVHLTWPGPQPKTLYLSDANETQGAPVSNNTITIPAYGITTLRATPAKQRRVGR